MVERESFSYLTCEYVRRTNREHCVENIYSKVRVCPALEELYTKSTLACSRESLGELMSRIERRKSILHLNQ